MQAAQRPIRLLRVPNLSHDRVPFRLWVFDLYVIPNSLFGPDVIAQATLVPGLVDQGVFISQADVFFVIPVLAFRQDALITRLLALWALAGMVSDFLGHLMLLE
jgi:hypothetical protein